MSASKHIVREIAGLIFLADRQLDQDGQAYLKSLKDSLSKLPPSLLVDALVVWSASGRPQCDPRPPIVRVMGEESPVYGVSLAKLRNHRTSGS